MTTSPVWLTERAYERLQRELDQLRRLRAANDEGNTPTVEDLAQTLLVHPDRAAARIEQIQDLLQFAVVGAAPPDDGIAEPGMVLTVRFDDTDETSTFLLGVREAVDSDDLEVYSPDSPLGAALCGAREGQRCTYALPRGASVGVTLLRAVPYGRHKNS